MDLIRQEICISLTRSVKDWKKGEKKELRLKFLCLDIIYLFVIVYNIYDSAVSLQDCVSFSVRRKFNFAEIEGIQLYKFSFCN